MAKKFEYPHMEILEEYLELISKYNDIEVKGKKNPYTSMNGNMFSFLDPNGNLSVRLSKEDKASFEKKHGKCPSIQHNSVMREYVLVPEEVHRNKRKMKNLFDKCAAYAATIKPK